MPFFPPDRAIFFVGDSVTDGATDETGNHGYPAILIQNLKVATHGQWDEKPLRLSGGGWQAHYIASIIDARLALMTDTPTYICVLLGANDTGGGTLPDEATYKADVAYILNALQTKWPGVPIYWSENHWETHETILATLRTWNASVLAGRANCYHGFHATDFMDDHPEWFVDVVHPNYAGFVQIAAAYQTLLGL